MYTNYSAIIYHLSRSQPYISKKNFLFQVEIENACIILKQGTVILRYGIT